MLEYACSFPPSRKLFMFHKCESSKYELMAIRGYVLCLIFFLDYKQVLIQRVASNNFSHKSIILCLPGNYNQPTAVKLLLLSFLKLYEFAYKKHYLLLL